MTSNYYKKYTSSLPRSNRNFLRLQRISIPLYSTRNSNSNSSYSRINLLWRRYIGKRRGPRKRHQVDIDLLCPFRILDEPARITSTNSRFSDMHHILRRWEVRGKIARSKVQLFFKRLTSSITKFKSLVVVIRPFKSPSPSPSPLPSTPGTLLKLWLACFNTIISCTISSSSTSKNLASFFAPKLVYNFKKLLNVGTDSCAVTSERKTASCRCVASYGASTELSMALMALASSYGGGLAVMNLGQA